MRNYRAFELGPNGQITSRFDFPAQDDEAAKEQARKGGIRRRLGAMASGSKARRVAGAKADLAQDESVDSLTKLNCRFRLRPA